MNEKLTKFTKCDIFTPPNICKIMTNKLNNKGSLLEPAVGTGNLLKCINTSQFSKIDVYDIKQKYLDKIQNPEINKYCQDFIQSDISEKYNNIIMNPPYIKVQDLPTEYRKYLKSNFKLLETGLVDIYYAFIIKSISLLKKNGVLVSITPNSYLYNKSALNLRKYLFGNRLVKEIIDFKDKKVFNNASVYCCITIFTNTVKKYLIYNNKKIQYTNICKNYSLFNFNNNNNKTLKDICKISNGIATLRDKIFIHKNKKYSEPCWKPITNGPVISYIIYPYKDGKIIQEDIFKQNNPQTYNYLCSQKEELATRDKGKKIYPAWYAFGRSQSIKYSVKKCIYIPIFIHPDKINTSFYQHKNILHKGCLCIEPNKQKDIEPIINIIKQNINFIRDNSSKRSGGWINLSSSTLYQLLLVN
jgi:tRNA1(Val) A37 N6-methylase TrmN6